MSDIISKKILVLGSRWSGKSLLIKRLEELCATSKQTNDDFLYTTMTQGKTLTSMKYKRNPLEIHEIGSTLTSLWKTFYSSTNFEKIVYVIDCTQPWSIAFTSEQLKDIAENIPMKKKNIILVLNKTNEINALNKTALIELLDLNTLWHGDVEMIETNARTGLNLTALLDCLIR